MDGNVVGSYLDMNYRNPATGEPGIWLPISGSSAQIIGAGNVVIPGITESDIDFSNPGGSNPGNPGILARMWTGQLPGQNSPSIPPTLDNIVVSPPPGGQSVAIGSQSPIQQAAWSPLSFLTGIDMQQLVYLMLFKDQPDIMLMILLMGGFGGGSNVGTSSGKTTPGSILDSYLNFPLWIWNWGKPQTQQTLTPVPALPPESGGSPQPVFGGYSPVYTT